MIIREVTVVAHEKRNHPYEYGHRDAEVRLTATIEDGDNLEDVLVSLRTRARLHVNQELLWWIRKIEAEVAKENHRRTFRTLIDHVHWCVNHCTKRVQSDPIQDRNRPGLAHQIPEKPFC